MAAYAAIHYESGIAGRDARGLHEAPVRDGTPGVFSND